MKVHCDPTMPEILSRLQRAAIDQGVWGRIPLVVAMHIAKAGIVIEDVDFSMIGDPIVMDAEGDLHLCSIHGVRAVEANDGRWGD